MLEMILTPPHRSRSRIQSTVQQIELIARNANSFSSFEDDVSVNATRNRIPLNLEMME